MLLSEIRSLQLEVTSHCNIRCPQCSRRDEDGNLAEYIDLKHWDMDKILENLQIDKLVNLQFIGIEGDNGDCMMHPHIEKLLDAFYKASIPISIVTNGSMRSPGWWKELGRKYVNGLRIQFSIDGLEDTHKIYRVDCDYNSVIANAKAFMEGGGEATQRTIVFKHNEHQIEQIAQKAKDDGFKQLIIIPNDINRFKEQDQWPVFFKGVRINTIHPTSLTRKDFSKFGFSNVTDPRFELIPNVNQYCPAFRKGNLYVTYKGHVVPCCGYHSGLYFSSPDDDKFKEIVGDTEKIDLHSMTLENIIDESNFYSSKLNNNLTSTNPLPKCLTFCKGQF